MAEFFLMPQASPTMTSGTLLGWRKEEGETLKSQDVLAEVETDKAAMDIEVFDELVLLKKLAEPGEDVPAGQPIAILGKSAGEDISALLAEFAKLKGGGAAPTATPAATTATAPVATATAPVVTATPAAATATPPVVTATPAAATATSVSAPAAPSTGGWSAHTWMGKAVSTSIMDGDGPWVLPSGVVRASPVARKVAAERGVNLARVTGSGPNGRILRADVEGAAQPAPAPAAPTRSDTAVRNTKMRRLIAQRLKESALDAPTFFLTVNLDCNRLVSFRNELNAQLAARGVKVSFNDLTIAAVARALADVPEANAAWGDEAITRFGRVDVGVAVALEDGLITPVVRDADRKPLAALSGEVKDLVERARARKLQPEEYSGATFSISNLGMMGIEHFTAIINPPASAILAVGALQQEPVVVDGALTVGWRMRVTMTCDHRVIDGALGARYLQALRGYIENPLRMVV